MYKLSDIVIGKFPTIQNYGEKPEIYSARYNLRGHSGIDIGCPSFTMVLAAASGRVLETGFDAGGYGNFIKLIHENFITLYGHLNDIVVKEGDQVIAGQLIGHSNNTGFSDSPHLHFAIAPCDLNGQKILDNGYGGYIDPTGSEVEWDVKNLEKPIVPEEQIKQTIPVAVDDLSIKTLQANNFLAVSSFVQSNGALEINVNDPKCGEKVNAFIAELLMIKQEYIKGKNQPQKSVKDVVKSVKKPAILKNIMSFIFVQKEKGGV